MTGAERSLSLSPDTTGVYTDPFWLNRTLVWGNFILPEEIRGDSCSFHIWARRSDVSGTAHFRATISIDEWDLASFDFYPASNTYQVYELDFPCVVPDSTAGREVGLTITLESQTEGEIRYGEGYESSIEIPAIVVPIPVLSVIDSLAVRSGPRDVAWDEGSSTVWYVDADSEVMIELDPDTGDELTEIPSPCAAPAGLSWDGVSVGGPYLWLSNADSLGGDDTIYKIDIAQGAAVDTFEVSLGWCTGLGWDNVTPGGPYLWCLDLEAEMIFMYQAGEGSLVPMTNAPPPDGDCRPLTVGSGSYWTATVTSDEDTIFTGWPGTTPDRFGMPGGPEDLPVGLALDETSPGGPFLWCADANRRYIYKLSPTPTRVEEGGEGDVPAGPHSCSLELHQNFPNPFGGETTIRFRVATPGSRGPVVPREGTADAGQQVRLAVYNLQGQLVRTLFGHSSGMSGELVARWDGRDVAGRPVGSGVYFVRLSLGSNRGEEHVTRKMVVLK